MTEFLLQKSLLSASYSLSLFECFLLLFTYLGSGNHSLHLRDLEKRTGGDSQYRVSESDWITINGGFSESQQQLYRLSTGTASHVTCIESRHSSSVCNMNSLSITDSDASILNVHSNAKASNDNA